MIQDDDREVLGRVKHTRVTREILDKKGFTKEILESSPNFTKITYCNYDLDLDLQEQEYYEKNRIEHTYTTSLNIPILNEDIHSQLHFETRYFTICTIGQLEAVMRYKEQLNMLNCQIATKIVVMDKRVNELINKYHI